jgi:hypothetical protein
VPLPAAMITAVASVMLRSVGEVVSQGLCRVV